MSAVACANSDGESADGQSRQAEYFAWSFMTTSNGPTAMIAGSGFVLHGFQDASPHPKASARWYSRVIRGERVGCEPPRLSFSERS